MNAYIAIQILLSLMLGSAIFMLIYSVFRYPVAPEPPIHRRIASAVGINRDTIFEHAVLAPVMSLAVAIARQISVEQLRNRVREDLNASGNPSGYAVEEYIAICLVMSMAMGSCGFILELASAGPWLLIVVPGLMVLGFFGPLWALKGEAKRRTIRIAKQLPYSLDLIALTMSSGSSFTEAVEALIRDNPTEDLNQELAVTLSEIEFGTTRTQALRNLAQRIPLESLRSVVGAVNQAESLGSPLSEILKLQSEMLRMQRSVRAEKLSSSAGLRILLPSMLILIAVVIVVFAPMALQYLTRGSLF